MTILGHSALAQTNCSMADSINNFRTQKFGNSDVGKTLTRANRERELSSRLAEIEVGLALSGANDTAKSYLYRSKGNGYLFAQDIEKAVVSFEKAISIGGLDNWDTDSLETMVEILRYEGLTGVRNTDRFAQALIVFPASIPTGLNESGYCGMKFDVNAEGVPKKIKATKCTNRRLKRASKLAVSNWKFTPKIVNKKAVPRYGVEAKVNYFVDEKCRNKLPRHLVSF